VAGPVWSITGLWRGVFAWPGLRNSEVWLRGRVVIKLWGFACTYLLRQEGGWHLVWSVGSELVVSTGGNHCGGGGGGGDVQREALVVVD